MRAKAEKKETPIERLENKCTILGLGWALTVAITIWVFVFSGYRPPEHVRDISYNIGAGNAISIMANMFGVKMTPQEHHQLWRHLEDAR